MEKTETKDLTHWPPSLSLSALWGMEERGRTSQGTWWRQQSPAWTSAPGTFLDPDRGPAGDNSETPSLGVFYQELVIMLSLLFTFYSWLLFLSSAWFRSLLLASSLPLLAVLFSPDFCVPGAPLILVFHGTASAWRPTNSRARLPNFEPRLWGLEAG